MSKRPFLLKLIFTFFFEIPFLLFFGAFVYFSYTTFRLYTSFGRTQGTVVSFVTKPCGNRSNCKTTSSKIVEYKVNNETKSFETIIRESNSGYVKGVSFPIFYNSQNYSESFIDDNSILIWPFAFFIVTLFSGFVYFSLLNGKLLRKGHYN